MKKSKIICITLAVILSFAVIPSTAFAEPQENFVDMPNDWSAAALEKSVYNGLLKGADGKILPHQNLSRAQMAAVIERAFGATEKVSLDKFIDISKYDWFYDSMSKAVFMKTFEGNGNKLRPNDNITREEAFVVLARSIKLSGTSEEILNKFSDKELVSQWAMDAVSSMVKAGYVSGTEGKLNPKQFITRAEFAQVMDNILKNYIDKPGTYAENLTGNVIIKVPDVVLSNMTINGDLIIADGVGNGDVTLDGVTVTGRTVIRGGGINSVKIIGKSHFQSIIIARVDGEVRVYTEDGTRIGDIIADGSDDVIIEGHFNDIRVISPDIIVTAINANIGSAVISGENSKIIVTSSSKANKIVLSSNNTTAEISGTVKNIETRENAIDATIKTFSGSKITNIEINSEGASVTGNGNVVSVDANADNIEVNTPNTTVTAGSGTSGVTAGGVELKSGQSAIVNSSGTGTKSPSYSKKQLTISDPVLTLSKVYDGDNIAQVVAGTLSGVNSGDTVQVTVAAYYDNSKAGTGKTITVEYAISGEAANKYIKPANYVVNTGEIKAKKLSVSNTSLTTAKEYDGNNIAIVSAGELSGIIDGDNVILGARAAYDSKIVGTNKAITVEYTISGDDSSNYIKPDSYVAKNGVISAKKLALTNLKLLKIKEYDGNLSAEANLNDELLTGVVQGDIVTIDATANYDNKSVGTNKTITVEYTIGGADSGNYIKPDNYETTDGVISAKQLTISQPTFETSKTYDGKAEVNVTKGNLSGVVAGDTVIVYATASYNNENAGTSKEITVEYAIDGPDRGNYLAPSDYIVKNGEILPRILTISDSILSLSKEYDGNTEADISIIAFSGNISDDDVNIAAEASYDSKEIGTNKTITISYVLSGSDSANYAKPDNYIVHNGEIKAKQLTTSGLSVNLAKEYDKSKFAEVVTWTLNGVVIGDDIVVNLEATYDTEDVGTGKTITVTYTISGADATKYIKPEDSILSNGEITAKQLSVSMPTLTLSKVYDGKAAANVTKGTLSGILSGDIVAFDAIASYDNKNAGVNKLVTVKYIIDGVDKDNYVVPSDYVVNTGEITAKLLGITEPTLTLSKKYDGNTIANVSAGSLIGVLEGETVNVNASAAYDDFNVGTGKTITVEYTLNGADSGNYIKPENYTATNGIILINEQNAPSGLTGIAPTSSANNDGRITGTTDKMEYRLSTDEEWTSVMGTEITDLIAGFYDIRLKAKTGYNASEITSVIVPEYTASLTSKAITNFDYSPTNATQASLISNVINSSDFSVNPVSFDIVDNQGNRIPVDLYWNITSDAGFTPAQLVGSGIESYIQQWFYDNKGGADGIMNRTLYAMGMGNTVTIGTFSTGSSSFVKLYEPDTTTPYVSDLFTNNVAFGTDGELRSATFTMKQGEYSAVITLNGKYSSISSMVAHINSQIAGTGVNATVVVDGTDKFTINGNNIEIIGTDKETFFSTFITK